MFKGVKRVLCVGIDKRCSYAFLLILYGFLLSTKMTTPETMTYREKAPVSPTSVICWKNTANGRAGRSFRSIRTMGTQA